MEDGIFPVAVIRPAAAPPGAVFSLGWLMAELFDPRRRVSVTDRQPPFNPAVQLPRVPDLTPDRKLVFLAAQLWELVTWYPNVTDQAARVLAETDRVKAAIRAAGVARQDVTGHAEPPGEARFPESAFLAAVSALHQAILDDFADNAERLSGYQLGLALSDLVWLAHPAATGEDPGQAASKPSALFSLFARPQVATAKTLLSGAGSELPAGTAAVVARSLDNWRDWIDVNMAALVTPGADAWSQKGATVLRALRVQGKVWHSVLTADPEVSLDPDSAAWVHAGASIARAAGKASTAILREFWPFVVIAVVVLVSLLYLVTTDLSGASQVWASLVTVAAVLGAGGASLSSGVSRSLDGVGHEIWAAAKLDAASWNITWLPALTSTAVDRVRMESRGVPLPQIRKNLDMGNRPH